MVILGRFLCVDGVRLKICGTVTRGVAHFHGVPHGAVNIADVILKKMNDKLIPSILLHRRDKRKRTSPDTWDICGGHLEGNKQLYDETASWEDREYLRRLFYTTAEREANEEFCILTKPDFKFTEKHLKCFGGIGAFEYGFDTPTIGNKEYSALYIAFVPEEILVIEEHDTLGQIVCIEDTIGKGGKPQESIASELRLVALEELILDYRKNTSDYADGIGRVLKKLINEPYTMTKLEEFINSYYNLI